MNVEPVSSLPSQIHRKKKPRSLTSIFCWSLLSSTVAFLTYFYVTNHILNHSSRLYQIYNQIYVTEQLDTSSFSNLRFNRIRTIIDIRPDGEDPKQNSSDEIREVAKNYAMQFAYIPVAHGPIPEQAVTDLQKALQSSPRPVLMYCRTGNRAARTFALVLASQTDGPNLEEILNMVKSTGHSAADLSEEIQSRIRERSQGK
jgi:uncharacterized protein (TIGR01244 family)